MNRRRVLEAGAIGLASVSLAGCLESDDRADDGNGEEDEVENGDTETFADDLDGGLRAAFDGEYGEIARWLPAPVIIDADPYRVSTMAPAALVAADDAIDQDVTEPITDLFEELAVDEPDPAAVDRAVSCRYGDILSPSASSSVVLEGGFDTAAMAATLEDGDYDYVRSDGEYEIHERAGDGDGDAYAVGEEVLVSSRGNGALGILEAVVDAERGTVERYADAHDGFGRLATVLPAGHITFVGPTSEEGSADEDEGGGESEGPLGTPVADGSVLQVEGDETLQFVATAFEETADSDGAVEDLLEESGAEADGDDSASGADDGVVWVLETRPTADVAL